MTTTPGITRIIPVARFRVSGVVRLAFIISKVLKKSLSAQQSSPHISLSLFPQQEVHLLYIRAAFCCGQCLPDG